MSLSAYALITVEDFRAWLNIEAETLLKDGLSVYGSDGTAASVAKTGTTMTLVKVGGTAPGTTVINLALATYDTLAELVVYINVLPGWVANLLGWGGASSADIKNIGATSCIGSANAETLQFYDFHTIERCIDRATALIEAGLNRKIKSRTYTLERYDVGEERADEILLNNFPVTAVGQVSCGALEVIRVKYTSETAYNAWVAVTTMGVELWVDGTKVSTLLFATYPTMTTLAAAIALVASWGAEVSAAPYATWSTTLLFENANRMALNWDASLEVPDQPIEDYDIDLAEGVVSLPSNLPTGFKNAFVTYAAGWATVPDDIVLGCLQLAQALWSSKETDPTMSSESAGDFSYSRSRGAEAAGSDILTKMLDPAAYAALMRYRRWRF